MIRHLRSLSFTIWPLILSWSLAAAFPLFLKLADWNPQVKPPEVPFVLTPGASGEHVRSSVYYLIVIIGVGMLCALPLEVSKFLATKHRFSVPLYVAFTTQQCLLLADVIRSYAWDWWLFLLSVTHISPIDEYTWMTPHISTVGSWPWPSGIAAALIIALVFFTHAKNIREGHANLAHS